MPKYTAGPWKLRTHPSVGCFVEAPKAAGMPYALDVCGDDYTGYGDEPQREANMRLIARAPALVEALRETVNAINQEFDAMGSDWKDQPIMRRKKKTLDKARALLAEIDGE